MGSQRWITPVNVRRPIVAEGFGCFDADRIRPNTFARWDTTLQYVRPCVSQHSMHDTSWSANLETERHAEDIDAVVEEAIDAVEHTAASNHVNLVTHGEHGHPETFLHDELRSTFGEDVAVEYVEQCGCGGHVTRVQVLE